MASLVKLFISCLYYLVQRVDALSIGARSGLNRFFCFKQGYLNEYEYVKKMMIL